MISHRGNYNYNKNNKFNNKSNKDNKENFNVFNEEIIKKLRIKVQKQEIDLKFLTEKIKKLEDEEFIINKMEKVVGENDKSRLTEKEVNILYVNLLIFFILNKGGECL